MENFIIGSITSFIEFFGGFLVYNIFCYNNLKKNIVYKMITAIIVSIIYIVGTSIYNVDQIIMLMAIIFVSAIAISKVDKKDTLLTFVELVMNLIVIFLIELIITFIVHLILVGNDASEFTYCFLLGIMLFPMIFALSKMPKVKKINLSKFIAKFKSINIIVLNLFIFFLLIKLLAAHNLFIPDIVIQITILGLIIVGVNCYFYVFLYKTLNEKKKKEIKKSFNPLIDGLIGKLKANEHEYKNHLNTIWSIAKVSNPEEIQEKIKEYIGNIIEENEEFSMILDIENTILKAVLYNKGQRAEKLGIEYRYNVKSDLKNITLDNSELTVILSNLLNNAIEATNMCEKKQIEINVYEEEKHYYIEVMNHTKDLKVEDLSTIFKMGYTTKGVGRGYGLYNVKQIIEKHRGKMHLSLEDDIINFVVMLKRSE